MPHDKPNLHSSIEDKTRVQFELPPRSLKRLNDLKRMTEATSYTELIKEAMRLYEDVILKREAGVEFFVKRDGVLEEYPIFKA